MLLKASENLANGLTTQQLFANYHSQLQHGYRDVDGEYPASCLDIAMDIASSLLEQGEIASFVRLRPDPSIAPYLRPTVYGGRVEWKSHMATMDDQRNVLDPFLAYPKPYEEYIESAFMDHNALLYSLVEGDEVQKMVDLEKIRAMYGSKYAFS